MLVASVTGRVDTFEGLLDECAIAGIVMASLVDTSTSPDTYFLS